MNEKPKRLQRSSSSLLDDISDVIIMSEENSKTNTNLESIEVRAIKINRNQRSVPISPSEISKKGELILSDKIDDELIKLKANAFESLLPMSLSIKETGLQNPISVYIEKGNFYLKTGQRRLLASLIAGKKTILARVYDKKESFYDMEVTQWVENFHREGLSTKDSVNAVKKIANLWKENSGKEITVTELSKSLFCSKGQATKYFALLHAPADVKDAIEKGKLQSLRKAYELTRVKDDAERSSLLGRVVNGAISQERLSKIAAKEGVKRHKNTNNNIKNDNAESRYAVDLGKVSSPRVVKDILRIILTSEKYSVLQSEFNIESDLKDNDVIKEFRRLIKKMESLEA